MALARRVELVAGVLAALLGTAGLAYALFGPTATVETRTAGPDGGRVIEHRTESLAEQGLEPVTAGFMAAALLVMLGVGAGAYVHARRGRPLGQRLMWLCTAILLPAAFLTGFSVGLFFLPAALAALAASVAGATAGGPAAAGRPSGDVP